MLDGCNDEQHIADYSMGWRSILPQKTVLVCFKADSDEIVGVNFNFVNSEEDNFFKKFADLLSVCELIEWASTKSCGSTLSDYERKLIFKFCIDFVDARSVYNVEPG